MKAGHAVAAASPARSPLTAVAMCLPRSWAGDGRGRCARVACREAERTVVGSLRPADDDVQVVERHVASPQDVRLHADLGDGAVARLQCVEDLEVVLPGL